MRRGPKERPQGKWSCVRCGRTSEEPLDVSLSPSVRFGVCPVHGKVMFTGGKQ